MFTNLDRYIHILSELKISANQFLLCYLLYTDQKVEGEYVRKGKAMANLYKYSIQAIPWTKEEVEDLVEKGYLLDPNYSKTDKTNPDYLEVTDKFCKFIFIDRSHFDELNRKFPTTMENFTNPNGPKIKLKVCDIDKMREVYLKKVKSKVKHRKIIEILDWAKENNEINFNFENFIRGELWNTLFEVKEGSKESIDNNMTVAQ